MSRILTVGAGTVASGAAGTAATTLNPLDKNSNVTLSGGDLSYSVAAAGNVRTKAAVVPNTRVYCELLVTTTAGSSFNWLGLTNSVTILSQETGGAENTPCTGAGYRSSDGLYRCAASGSHGAAGLGGAAGVGSTICIAFDSTNNKIWGRLNGGNWNNSGANSPNVGSQVGGYDVTVTPTAPFHVVVGGFSNTDAGTVRLASADWAFSPPTGFGQLNDGVGSVRHDLYGSTALQASGTSISVPASSFSPGTFNLGSGPNGSSDRGLVAALMFSSTGSGTVTGLTCTWNGVPLTFISGPFSSTGNGETFLFGMVNPATGANTFAASWTGTARCQVNMLSMVGVLQTGGSTTFHGPASASGSASPVSMVSPALFNEISFLTAMTQNSFSTIGTGGFFIGADNSAGLISCTASGYWYTATPTTTWSTASGNWHSSIVAIAGL